MSYETFDWVAFCNSNAIPYVERGANVARGHVNIKCPFCGPGDPSEHMGLNTGGSRWGCWRDAEHRGIKPHKLVQELLGCTWKEAKAIVEESTGHHTTTLDELQGLLRKIDSDPRRRDLAVHRRTADVSENIEPPPGLFRIGKWPDDSQRALRYLRKRGFTSKLKKFVSVYDPRYATRGRFQGRVAVPLNHGGVTRGYIGRAIGTASKRYLAYPEGESLRDWIWNYDLALRATGAKHLAPPKCLVIQEGWIDAAKLDHYGRGVGVRSVALLGLSLSGKKLQELIALCRRYPVVRVCLDAGAQTQALAIERKLALCRARALWLPDGWGDVGEMDPASAREFALSARR
jgi:hypothetical protein